MRVQSLGWEDPLEKEVAAHSSILAWRIPRTEEPGGLQSPGSQRVGHGSAHTHTRTQARRGVFAAAEQGADSAPCLMDLSLCMLQAGVVRDSARQEGHRRLVALLLTGWW